MGNLDAAIADEAARVRRPAVVPVAHQGPGPGRLLDRARWAWARSRRCSRRWPIATCAPTSSRAPGAAASAASWPLVGDAELDEGNVWEAVLEDALTGWATSRGSSTSTARAWTGSSRASASAAAGAACSRRPAGRSWRRSTAAACRQRFAPPGGEALRERIDEMTNEEYQILHPPARRGGARAAHRRRRAGRPRRPRAQRRRRPGRRGPAARCWPTWAATTIARAGAGLLARPTRTATGPTVDLRLHHQGLAAAVRGRRR